MLIDRVKALRDQRDRLYDSELQIVLSHVVAYLEAEREAANGLHAALTRLLVGVTGRGRPGCEYYDGLTGDAITEAEAALAATEGTARP